MFLRLGSCIYLLYAFLAPFVELVDDLFGVFDVHSSALLHVSVWSVFASPRFRQVFGSFFFFFSSWVLLWICNNRMSLVIELFLS